MQSSSHTHEGKDKARMKKKLKMLEKALGVVAARAEGQCGWVEISEVRLTGNNLPESPYLELETLISKVKSSHPPTQTGATLKWASVFTLWIDNSEEEQLLISIKEKKIFFSDPSVGSSVAIPINRISSDVPVVLEGNTGAHKLELKAKFAPASKRERPIVPKGDACQTIADFNIPQARFAVHSGGMNDYYDCAAPKVANRVMRGGINDYGDFSLPTYKSFRLKRGGMNDYADFVLPANFKAKTGGMNDYHTI